MGILFSRNRLREGAFLVVVAVGGGGFSQGGAASRGSLSGSRPDSGSQATRQAGASNRQASRQNTAKDLQSNRQDFKRENREDWQDHANQAREDRQEYRDKARDEWIEAGDDWHGDRWEHPVATGLAVGAAMAVGTAITASAFNAMTCLPR